MKKPTSEPVQKPSSSSEVNEIFAVAELAAAIREHEIELSISQAREHIKQKTAELQNVRKEFASLKPKLNGAMLPFKV
jgi:hypothetical protein